MKRLTVILVALLVSAVVATGCAGGNGDESASPPTRTDEYLIGEIIKAGDLTMRLNGVRRLPESEFDLPSIEGNIFLSFDLTFENAERAPDASAQPSQFTLEDAGGARAVQADHSDAQNLTEDPIPSGRSRRGEVVFEVPKSAKGLRLTYKPTNTAIGDIVWGVGDVEDLR